MTKKLIRKIAAYLALAVIVLYIITGYGITQYKIVEGLTFGLLGKALSTKIHFYLIIPFLLFLLVHLYCSCDLLKWLRNLKMQKKSGKRS